MRKSFKILLAVLMVLSIATAVGYKMYERSRSSLLPPEIQFEEGIISVPTKASDEQLLKGVTATDPEDGDVTASVIVEGMSKLVGKNNVTVSYIAFDSQNHMTRAERTVHLTDYHPPRFALKEPLCFRLSNNINILKCIQANDILDGDISKKVKYTVDDGSLLLKSVGECKITLSVTNSLGQTVKLPVTVDITNANSNSSEVMLDEYLIYIKKGASFDAESHIVGYTDNGVLHKGADGVSISGSVNTNTPGIYTVKYSYGSEQLSGYTKLVVVVE